MKLRVETYQRTGPVPSQHSEELDSNSNLYRYIRTKLKPNEEVHKSAKRQEREKKVKHPEERERVDKRLGMLLSREPRLLTDLY